MTRHFPFDNSYARLPSVFYSPVRPTPVSAPALLALNEGLALSLGLDPEALATDEAVEIFAGTRVPEGAEPIALAYAGHQFGHFVPQLGDGRAILLGEVVDTAGARRDVQLKGSGPTPFSRRGDGRAALGPVLREYLVSEAMAALGIPTTRSLAAVTTGENVIRDTRLPGAVLTRIAASHIRIGTFQYFAARRNDGAVRQLADYAIARHYPDAAGAEKPYHAFFEAVLNRQAELVARWLSVGFIHGVMNTDNMSIAGETIDYGPCAFMDAYDPKTVFSSIDHQGRYAYLNQPGIAHWNLARLAECLVPFLADTPEAGIEEANALLGLFPDRFDAAYVARFREKVGLMTPRAGDVELIHDLLDLMKTNGADFTLTFRRLADAVAAPDTEAVADLFVDRDAFRAWAERWRARLAQEPADWEALKAALRKINPAVIPRNHLVEEAIAAAAEGDLGPFRALHRVLATPFDDPEPARYADLPPAGREDYRTFCGT